MPPSELRHGSIYSWDELADVFGFKANYLGIAGGMPVSAATNSVLLITHPKGGAAFDYRDYWDGGDLIYTGRGTEGDQKRTGPNLDVARNRRALYVFEAAGPRYLRYLGLPRCVEEFTAQAPDRRGRMRQVLRFRLRFADGAGHAHSASA
jgi:hypothetical protein